MKINIIIPAYNESSRLPETIRAYYEYFFLDNGKTDFAQKHDLYLNIINDGSFDNTEEIAWKLLKEYKLKGEVMGYDKNQGKGFAVKTGMLNTRKADYYYLADSDMSSSWATLQVLFNQIIKSQVDCVIGSRAMKDSITDTNLKRFISGRIGNILINMFLKLGLKDTQCGYKLFSKTCLPAFQKQILFGWGFDFENLYIIKNMGLQIIEKGIEWENRIGSKVKFTDYFLTIKELIKVKRHDYKFEDFFE